MAIRKATGAAAMAVAFALALPAVSLADGPVGELLPDETQPVTDRVYGEQELVPSGQTGAGDSYEAGVTTTRENAGQNYSAGGELLVNVAEAGSPSGDGAVAHTYDKATDTAVTTATATVEDTSIDVTKTRERDLHYTTVTVTTADSSTSVATPTYSIPTGYQLLD